MGVQVIQAITQCIKGVTVEEDLYELDEDESIELDDEVVTFDLIERIKTLIKKLQEKVKCTVNAVETIIGEGQLRNVYQQFHSDVKNLLKYEGKHCLETEGVSEKLK